MISPTPPGLTRRQDNFARHYVEHRTAEPDLDAAEQAYRVAFNVVPSTKVRQVRQSAGIAMRHPPIAARIEELTLVGVALLPAALSARDCTQLWLDMATADPDELVGLRVGCCRYCWGDGGGYQWREEEYLAGLAAAEREGMPMPEYGGGFGYQHFDPPNAECRRCGGEGAPYTVARDTSKLSPGARMLFGGIKQTRNGPEVVVLDRTKAVDALTRILGGYKDTVDVTAKISGAMAVAALHATTDPHEAERRYREMVASK